MSAAGNAACIGQSASTFLLHLSNRRNVVTTLKSRNDGAPVGEGIIAQAFAEVGISRSADRRILPSGRNLDVVLRRRHGHGGSSHRGRRLTWTCTCPERWPSSRAPARASAS